MLLKGITVDTIESVSRPLFRMREDVDDPHFMLAWEEFALLYSLPSGVVCPYGGTFEAKLEAYWRTLITDRFHRSGGNLRAPPAAADAFQKWRLNMIQNADPTDEDIPVTAENC